MTIEVTRWLSKALRRSGGCLWGRQNEVGSLRQGKDLVSAQGGLSRREGAGLLPVWMARTLTALLLREISGNREPLGAGEGLDWTPGKGYSWARPNGACLGSQPWALLTPSFQTPGGGQRQKRVLWGRIIRGAMNQN